MFKFNMARVLVFVLFLIWHNVNCHTRSEPLVETNQGSIRGIKATDGDYSMFLGIPYANIDKNNPFGLSTPYPKFETVFVANNESAVCPQYDNTEKKVIGTLDCLHLNIFVPNSASTQNPLPVLVWIYGGRFERGLYQSNKVAPQFLLKKDVIVVAFNYRTGPYGFMCLDTPEVPGNAGLKDQALALKWIKNNIESFGGDVNQVTLGGQSAGAVSVDFHLLYNKDFYFTRAILNSGTTQCPWAIIDSDRNEPLQLAKTLGYNTNDLNDAIAFLSRTEPTEVIAAKQQLTTVSRPCVEKKFDNIESFVYDYPINMKFNKTKTIPILLGYTYDELFGEYISFPREYYEDNNLFTSEISISFDFGDKSEEMGNFFKHFYVGDTVGEASKRKIIDFESDFRFNHPVQRTINSFIESGLTQIYHYIFSYIGDRTANLINNMTMGGSSHGDDIRYIFDYAIYKDKELTNRDQVMIEMMTTMFTNFFKYGDPVPATTDTLLVKWLPVTRESFNYLNIDSELTMSTRPFHERLTFWDYFYTVNKKFQVGYREE